MLTAVVSAAVAAAAPADDNHDHDHDASDPRRKAIRLLSGVWGIGPKMADNLSKQGYSTIEHLRHGVPASERAGPPIPSAPEPHPTPLPSLPPATLTNHARLGLRYQLLHYFMIAVLQYS